MSDLYNLTNSTDSERLYIKHTDLAKLRIVAQVLGDVYVCHTGIAPELKEAYQVILKTIDTIYTSMNKGDDECGQAKTGNQR